MARPSKYSDELAEKICIALASGQTLLQICAPQDMPSTVTVYSWLAKKEDFLNKYTRAREDQAEYYADEILEIADTCIDPAVAKVRIDARKWHAEKTKPKKFGKLTTTQLQALDRDGEPTDMNVMVNFPDAPSQD